MAILLLQETSSAEKYSISRTTIGNPITDKRHGMIYHGNEDFEAQRYTSANKTQNVRSTSSNSHPMHITRKKGHYISNYFFLAAFSAAM